tara:strand:- start:4842 stop:6638 length:1797 start_codon:yes stop_codon:yes gene_type:complete
MSYALVSVSDKRSIHIVGDYLTNNGYRIISSGGTYKRLRELYEDYPHLYKVEDITGFPEILGGRVKTLHPYIHGGILALSNNDKHINELHHKGIHKISIVVVNLYPFKRSIQEQPDNIDNAIENIDIGGHTLIRAAAKNYKDVLTITNPDDYERIFKELTVEQFNSEEVRRNMAEKAWKHITDYDITITQYFNKDSIYRHYEKKASLKYGCNPHQNEAFLNKISNGDNVNDVPFEIINGNPGYINILDAINSWQLVNELGETLQMPVAASFKHTSPAGVGVGMNEIPTTLKKAYFLKEEKEYSPTTRAYIRARNADPMSSFGDFIAIYGIIDEELARFIKREISDGIIANDYTPIALQILKEKKRGKYIILKGRNVKYNQHEYRELGGLCLSQNVNNAITTNHYLDKIVTKNQSMNTMDKMNLIIANTSLKYAQSNSVAYAYEGQLIGLGAGQQSRVDCVKLAGRKADIWFLRSHPKVLQLHQYFVEGTKRQAKVNACIRYIEGDFTTIEKEHWDKLFVKNIEPLTTEEKNEYISKQNGVALASDAFFPFRDNIDHASKHGIRCVIQPGGSIADTKIIEACNEYGITMCFSNIRVFTH